jgi:hypothetical protein
MCTSWVSLLWTRRYCSDYFLLMRQHVTNLLASIRCK